MFRTELISGEYHLHCDDYSQELTRLLSFYGTYDLNNDRWIIPVSNISLVESLLKQVESEGHKSPTDKLSFDNRLNNLILVDKIHRHLKSLPYPPLSHQSTAIPMILSQPSFLLGDDMGLGKSFTGLAVSSYLLKETNKPVLIFCQKRAMKQWMNYANKYTPGLDIIIVDGPANKRKKLWGESHQIYITNLEKLLYDFDFVNKGWQLIILDEASYYIKNPSSKRAKAICKLTSDRKLALTGTPIENSLIDLYSLFMFLKPEIFMNYGFFERNYVVFIRQHIYRGRKRVEFKKIIGYKNIDQLKEKISKYYIRRTEKDAGIELPEIVEEDFIIPMEDEQKTIYDNLLNGIKGLKTKQLINTDNNRIKLLRAADHSNIIVKESNSSNKIETLLELIEENSHRKIIVFSQWADMINLIHIKLKSIGINHAVVVGSGSKDKFDFHIDDESEFVKFKEDVNILIATDAISRSQDFPFASVIINIDLPWNPATIKQRIMRARRISSTNKTIFAFNLISEGTIEEKVLPVLQSKMRLAKEIIDENEFQKSNIDSMLDLYSLISDDGE